MAKVLVTGGAGFIGSHLVDALVSAGHDVTVFDNLEPQVHGDDSGLPEYYNHDARFIKGDVRDYDAFKRVLRGQEIVFHQAAMVGVGQSMYQVKRYMDVNTGGTANLMDIIVNHYRADVKKVIVASSMSIYGEGAYVCQQCGRVEPGMRAASQMAQKDWEQRCPTCGVTVQPAKTPETKRLDATSIYALSKKDQEELTLITGKSYRIPVVALRYFNVYGPRQSLNNPYTGVCAIFSSAIKNNNQPIIYEDGAQSRDFVSVHDIVRANLLAMEHAAADYNVFNVGTSMPTTIKEVAQVLTHLYGTNIAPRIEHQYRAGDIRHCIADISAISAALSYAPRIHFEDGMRELVEWGRSVDAIDRSEHARAELIERGLTR